MGISWSRGTWCLNGNFYRTSEDEITAVRDNRGNVPNGTLFLLTVALLLSTDQLTERGQEAHLLEECFVPGDIPLSLFQVRRLLLLFGFDRSLWSRGMAFGVDGWGSAWRRSFGARGCARRASGWKSTGVTDVFGCTTS